MFRTSGLASRCDRGSQGSSPSTYRGLHIHQTFFERTFPECVLQLWTWDQAWVPALERFGVEWRLTNRPGSTPELEWECLGIRLFLGSAPPTCCVAVKINLFPLNSRFICKVQTVASALVCPAMGTVIGGGSD